MCADSLPLRSVVILAVVGLASVAWGGSVRAPARTALPVRVRGSHFKSLPAMGLALRRAIAAMSRPMGSQKRVLHAPPAVAAGSGTCFVGPGACSEHPCVVYTGTSSTSTVYVPLAAAPRPAKCSRATGMARVSAATATVTAASALPVRSP